MTLYVDSSALLKRYVDEPDSPFADELLASDDQLVTTRLTEVEVRRNLARLLTDVALLEARSDLSRDLEAFAILELDAVTCATAAQIAEQTGLRTLDALHLGAAMRIGFAVTFATFDLRQAQAARSLGLMVVGA